MFKTREEKDARLAESFKSMLIMVLAVVCFVVFLWVVVAVVRFLAGLAS